MIDIVIPVYNTPIKDLKRCFNSIEKQSYKDYFVYIIDDGSKEDVKKFIDIYVKNHSNFMVKHIVNGGVSAARNIGINLSKNKYITFIDSDDSIKKNFLKEAYELLIKYDLDVIIGGYNEKNGNKIIRVRKCLKGIHLYEKDNLNLFFQKLLSSKVNKYNKELDSCPTGRIYTRLFKKDSIGSLRFNENINISEDTLFMIDYMKKVKRIGVIDKIWYDYYKNTYSITSSTDNKKLIKYMNDFIIEVKKRMEKENDKNLKLSYKLRIQKSKDYIKKHKK